MYLVKSFFYMFSKLNKISFQVRNEFKNIYLVDSLKNKFKILRDGNIGFKF